MPELIFQDGTRFAGESFGYDASVAGEIAFTTGMMGYPESLTDPSFAGQVLAMSYPLIGSYGVPPRDEWESSRIQVSGLIVANYIDTPSHYRSTQTLGAWLKAQHVPALIIPDTRHIVQKIRDKGAALVKIRMKKDIDFTDPNATNLVARVSAEEVSMSGSGRKTVVLVDCGAKENIVWELLKRHVKVIRVPWDYDFVGKGLAFDGVLVSNGPGDPKQVTQTIFHVKKAMERRIPIFGICLGNQILALAAGGDTYKLKFGHRGQNQPCNLIGTSRCYITTQNHGFAIGKMPPGFSPWFVNANDGTNEGIRHKTLPFMSVQFHPEAAPGPLDTTWLFDEFVASL